MGVKGVLSPVPLEESRLKNCEPREHSKNSALKE